MKLTKLFVVVIAGLALSAVSSRAQLTLNFAATDGSAIQFNGTNSSFQFIPPIGNPTNNGQWSITTESGGNSAIGLLGQFGNSQFGYGTISTDALGGGNFLYTANVTGPLGILSIQDSSHIFLTGSVNWEQIDTFDFSGALNAMLTVNVSGLAYAGSNPDLNTLVAEQPASMDVTFQFSPGMTLPQLTSGAGPYESSFSGSISVVPEPATVSCLLLGFGVLAFARRFRQDGRG
jgi:hypothetical protein